MAWQEIPTPVFDDEDGTHYFQRAEEWPAPARKSRFWIDAKLPPGLRPPAAMTRYLVLAVCEAHTIEAAMAIDLDAEGGVIARFDWLAAPRNLSDVTTPAAACAILDHFCKRLALGPPLKRP